MRFFSFENIDWSDTGSNIFFFGSASLLGVLFIYIIIDNVRNCKREDRLLDDCQETTVDNTVHKNQTNIREIESSYSEL